MIKSMSRSDFTVMWNGGKFEIYDKVFDDIVHIGEGSLDDAEKWIAGYIKKVSM